MAERPIKIDLYSYNVFFGDCFLLVFEYPGAVRRSVLIDYGSTGKGKVLPDAAGADDDETQNDSTGERMLKIAMHIKEACGNSLDVVVATHRHKDHIYGFGLKESGRIIRECRPKIVIQPWTENPDDNRDLTNKNVVVKVEEFKNSPQKNFAVMLSNMHDVAASIEAEAMHLDDSNVYKKTIEPGLRDNILFAAGDNKVKNAKAVENLHAMGSAEGAESHYVSYGYDQIDWATILPGVDVRFLGPPTLEQSNEITSATNTSDEFWSLQAMNNYFWGVQSATSRGSIAGGDGTPLFSPEQIKRSRPANVRWIIRRLRSIRASQLLEIVRFVDTALNNTSVIMLFEVGDQKLLFPGDAQIENWQYALGQPGVKALLKDTTLYKVGHHGSRNATPKSLWNNFKRRTTPKAPVADPMTTVISTMQGKHGDTPDTAVPLPKMVAEMRLQSKFRSTEDLKGRIVDHIEIKVS